MKFDYSKKSARPVTDQTDAIYSDINFIVACQGVDKITADYELMKSKFGYADVSNLPDYQTCLNYIISAQKQYEALPSEIRDYFKGDIDKFLRVVQSTNDKDLELCYALGLKNRPKPKPIEVDNVVPIKPRETEQT